MTKKPKVNKRHKHQHVRAVEVYNFYQYSPFIGVSPTFRESYLRMVIYKAFEKHLFDIPDGWYSLITFTTEFKKILPEMKELLELSVADDLKSGHPDNRTAEETYGFDNVYDDLHYISDRWYCTFRLRWLIAVVSKNWIYEYGEGIYRWERIKND